MFKVKNSQEAFQKYLTVLPILYKGIEEVTKVVAYQLGKPSIRIDGKVHQGCFQV